MERAIYKLIDLINEKERLSAARKQKLLEGVEDFDYLKFGNFVLDLLNKKVINKMDKDELFGYLPKIEIDE